MKSNLLERGVIDTPVDYWLAMFTEQNLEVLTIETNRYMNLKASSSRIPMFKTTEMQQCLGILAYMSIVRVL